MLPPIIYLNCHDAGRMVQPYGYPVSTPHLQRFAEESVVFRQAHSAAPTCSPSRAALLTGRYPHQVGMFGLAHRGFALNDYDEHLARRLQRMGYRTILAGHQHVATHPDQIGYDEVLAIPRGGYALNDLICATNAARAIEIYAEERFYLECGLFFPHRPFLPAPKGKGGYVPPFLPDIPSIRADFRDYAVSIEAADQAFGVILNTLRRTELWDRAIIIVTTDHGPAFPLAKCNLNDQGTGVMLMIRFPGGEMPGECDAPVSHLDILPTLLELTGQAPDPKLEGLSLLKILQAPEVYRERELIAEINYHAAYEPTRSIRKGKHRYVRRFNTSWQKPVMPNIDDGLSKEALNHSGFTHLHQPAEALYDTHLDPISACNRINDPHSREIAQDLSARLDKWMEATHDPLRHGAIAFPPSALVIAADAYSPSPASPVNPE